MNILVVQETDWLNNLPLQTHHIMEYLSRKGHSVQVIDFEADWKPSNFLESMRLNVFANARRTDTQSSVRLMRPGVVKVPGVARLSAFLSEFILIFDQLTKWADVVVLYAVPTYGVQTVLVSKLLSKPLVFHSYDVLHRMVHVRPLRPPTWALERFIYPKADKVIVISTELRTYMEDIGVKRDRIVVLPPGVDTEKFNPSISGHDVRKQLGISSEEKIALFSGWLYEFAGVDLVLESMNEILKGVPEFRLIVCGDGPLSIRLADLRSKLGVEDKVHLLGRRPFQEMPSIIAAADVCINPYLADIRSLYAFPSKIAEYMAAGKAVVSTNLPGTTGILGDNSGAILVPSEHFVDSLRKVLTDNENRHALGKQCRRFCENNLSLRSVSDKFETVLGDSINHHALL
jgi:glycosyltransferase involved in cell wall biosynthesis